MLYDCNWVIENIHITRSLMRTYEKMGFFGEKRRNPTNDNKCVTYSEEDIRKWKAIAVFTAMGFGSGDMRVIFDKNSNINFCELIHNRVIRLENKIAKMEKQLYIARMLEEFKYLPMCVGDDCMTFEDVLNYSETVLNTDVSLFVNFYKNLINSEKLKCENSKEQARAVELIDKISNSVPDEKNINIIKIMVFGAYFRELCKYKHLNCNHSEVQRIVSGMYNAICEWLISENALCPTPEEFSDVYVSALFEYNSVFTDIYGSEECEFISEAVLWFKDHYKTNK